MAFDTLATLIGKVQQRVGSLPDQYLLVDWVVGAAREVFRDRDWTFRRRRGQFLFFAPYNTGLATITRGYNYADFSGATLDNSMTGRQFRIGVDTPIMTIKQVVGNRVYFDANWGAASVAAQAFEIYQAYFAVPTDFDSFISIVDMQRGFQLDWWNCTSSDLDRVDARRAISGNQAVAMVLHDFTDQSNGIVGSVIQVHGSGSVPVSGGSYTGVEDAVITVEMTAAAIFKWRKGSGAFVTGVAVDVDGNDQSLCDGVSVAFPTTGTYVNGDTFVIPCSASYSGGIARMEAWPHIKADEVRSYMYVARPPDLNDPGATLSRYIPGDLIVEKALAAAARWNSEGNKYFNLKLSMLHDARAATMLEDVAREDAARESSDLTYDEWTKLPVMDSSYLAARDVGYEIDTLDGGY